MQYAIVKITTGNSIITMQWFIEVPNCNSIMQNVYLGAPSIYIFSNTLQGHTITRLYITIIIIFLLYIKSEVSALTYIFALWKASKGKKPLAPGWHATVNKKTGSYIGWKWGFHWEVLWLRAHLCTLGPSLASPPLELLAAACMASAQLCGSCVAECILSAFLVHVWMKRVYIRNAHFKDSVAWTA